MSVYRQRSLLSDPFFSEQFGLGPSITGPSMDWKETPEAHIFKFDLPGLTRDDVKLQVHDDRVLHVSADSKDEEETKNYHKWHCRERLHGGSFSREFRLPENAVVDEIRASMSEGVLVVTVPKDRNKNKKRVKKRAVEIGGDGESSASGKGLSRFVCCKA